MTVNRFFFLFVITLFFNYSFAQKTWLNFSDYASENPTRSAAFALEKISGNAKFIEENKSLIKFENAKWVYVQCSAEVLMKAKNEGKLERIYFEFANPQPLSDTAMVRHKINLVQNGVGLDTNYTGKGIIVGIVDQGIDFNHPDFKTSNGKTRVMRYWDHTVSPTDPLQPYNYGKLWTNLQIDAGTCTSLETVTAHGTTVSGIATGNARANSTNKGAAPEADIVVVETDFNLPNWSLTIADACDYIFKYADSVGKPAVVNLSLGSYLGSHDARDPAAVRIEQLLDEKPGRIVVCAAGNSGAQGKYHVKGIVSQDTTFVWCKSNPANTLVGSNKILFDLWMNQEEANHNFAFGADLPAPNYAFRGRTNFRNWFSCLNTVPTFDTLYSSSGNRLACIETYAEIVDGNFHAQIIFRTIDSTDYLYRFETVGSGSYDIWGGSWQRLSDFETQVPSPFTLPAITRYQHPDSLQSIVSSWNCSPKVVSVANIRNRSGHTDKNGNWYSPSDFVPVGSLENSSSKGPTRLGLMKPDVAASGGVSLASGPVWFISNTANNSQIDQGGFHVRNGGTSMASPVVAGSAALYLQKCSKATYQDFISDLQVSSTTSPVTGTTPNTSYGYGILNTQALFSQKHRPVTISGPNGICPGSTATLSLQSSMIPTSISWVNGSTTSSITTSTPGNYRVVLTDALGCKSRSNIQNLAAFSIPFVDAGQNQIICPGTSTILSGSGTATNYIWNNEVVNSVPFTPTIAKMYQLTGYNSNGCFARDSVFVELYNLEPVTYDESVSTISMGSNPFNVVQGIPSGGTYSGPGIIGTSFHPGLAGIGTHAIVYAVPDIHGCLSTDTSYITVFSNVGVEENENRFQVFPNPFNEVVNFNAETPCDLILFDVNGAQILELRNVLASELHFEKLSSGIYFLSVQHPNEKPKIVKLIKSPK